MGEQEASFQEWESSLQHREGEIIENQGRLDTLAKEVEVAQEVMEAKRVEMASELSGYEERMSALHSKEAEQDERSLGLDKATVELANLENHLQKVESDIRDCPYCDAKDNFIRTRQLIEDAEAMDADVTDARRMMRKAQDRLDEGDFDGAVKEAFEAQKSARQARATFLKAGIRFVLSSTRKSLDSLMDRGVNVSEAKRILERARDASVDGRYEEAEQMAREADDLGRLLHKQYDDYQGLRAKAMATIADGSADNEQVPELVAEADGRASGGDYRRGIEALEKACALTVEDNADREPPARVVKEKVSRKRMVVAEEVTEGLPDEGPGEEEPTPDGPEPPGEEVTEETLEEVPDLFEEVEEEDLQEEPQEGEVELPDEPETQEEPEEEPQEEPRDEPQEGELHCPTCGAELVVKTSIRPTIVRCASCQASVTLR